MERCPLGLNRVPDRLLRRVEAIPKISGCAGGLEKGASNLLWSGGTTNTPIEEFGPAIAFDATFDGKQSVGASFRPAEPRPSQSKKWDAPRKRGRIPMLLAGQRRDAVSH